MAKVEEKIEKEVEKEMENEIEKEVKKEEKLEEKKEAPITEKEVEEKKDVRAGIAYIFSSQNNTMVHITDLAGNTISRASGGMVTKHSRLKSDPTIAMFVAKKAAERAKDLGINSLYIRMRAKTGSENGIGSGAHSAVKSLDKSGFKILSVLDTTRVPRGGPKRPGGKRGRRV